MWANVSKGMLCSRAFFWEEFDKCVVFGNSYQKCILWLVKENFLPRESFLDSLMKETESCWLAV